jgi:hypothetical protein
MRLECLTYKELIREGVSEPVARFVTAEVHPIKNFDIFAGPINPGWDYAIPSAVDNVVGLWDRNANAYCRWVRHGRREFVLLYHDDPNHEVVAYSEQGLLAELVRGYHEGQNWSIEDETACEELVRSFADYVGFRYVDQLLMYMETPPRTSDFHAAFLAVFGRLE